MDHPDSVRQMRDCVTNVFEGRNRPRNRNPDGDLVIMRRHAWDEDDVWIVAQTQIWTVIDAMEKVLTEVQRSVRTERHV
jgi:hypothetical protein